MLNIIQHVEQMSRKNLEKEEKPLEVVEKRGLKKGDRFIFSYPKPLFLLGKK